MGEVGEPKNVDEVGVAERGSYSTELVFSPLLFRRGGGELVLVLIGTGGGGRGRGVSSLYDETADMRDDG